LQNDIGGIVLSAMEEKQEEHCKMHLQQTDGRGGSCWCAAFAALVAAGRG